MHLNLAHARPMPPRALRQRTVFVHTNKDRPPHCGTNAVAETAVQLLVGTSVVVLAAARTGKLTTAPTNAIRPRQARTIRCIDASQYQQSRFIPYFHEQASQRCRSRSGGYYRRRLRACLRRFACGFSARPEDSARGRCGGLVDLTPGQPECRGSGPSRTQSPGPRAACHANPPRPH